MKDSASCACGGGERLDRKGRPYIVCSCPEEPNTHPSLKYGLKQSAWNRLRKQVFARDGGVCRYCGTRPDAPHCDHVQPWAKGGTNDLDNLATSCGPCNIAKKARTPDQWVRS